MSRRMICHWMQNNKQKNKQQNQYGEASGLMLPARVEINSSDFSAGNLSCAESYQMFRRYSAPPIMGLQRPFFTISLDELQGIRARSLREDEEREWQLEEEPVISGASISQYEIEPQSVQVSPPIEDERTEQQVQVKMPVPRHLIPQYEIESPSPGFSPPAKDAETEQQVQQELPVPQRSVSPYENELPSIEITPPSQDAESEQVQEKLPVPQRSSSPCENQLPPPEDAEAEQQVQEKPLALRSSSPKRGGDDTRSVLLEEEALGYRGVTELPYSESFKMRRHRKDSVTSDGESVTSHQNSVMSDSFMGLFGFERTPMPPRFRSHGQPKPEKVAMILGDEFEIGHLESLAEAREARRAREVQEKGEARRAREVQEKRRSEPKPAKEKVTEWLPKVSHDNVPEKPSWADEMEDEMEDEREALQEDEEFTLVVRKKNRKPRQQQQGNDTRFAGPSPTKQSAPVAPRAPPGGPSGLAASQPSLASQPGSSAPQPRRSTPSFATAARDPAPVLSTQAPQPIVTDASLPIKPAKPSPLPRSPGVPYVPPAFRGPLAASTSTQAQQQQPHSTGAISRPQRSNGSEMEKGETVRKGG